MNIKIDQPIPESQVIITIPVGSRVYGTSKVDSDSDFVKIIYDEDTQNILQWSGLIDNKKVDYVYFTLENFKRLVLEGGDTLAWEAALYCDFQIAGHDLSKFNRWRITKTYLGLVRRDLEFYPDRIKHVCRCLSFAVILMKGELPILEDVKWIPIIMDKPHLKDRHLRLRTENNKRHGIDDRKNNGQHMKSGKYKNRKRKPIVD